MADSWKQDKKAFQNTEGQMEIQKNAHFQKMPEMQSGFKAEKAQGNSYRDLPPLQGKFQNKIALSRVFVFSEIQIWIFCKQIVL